MYDVAIIGAGVVGSAIARELSRYAGSVCVIERDEDVCTGTSKANSAIVHAGFDAEPGSLKAKLNVEGNAMMDELSKKLDIPFRRNGSFVVRTKDQSREGLEKLLEKGKKNGVPDIRILSEAEAREMEPNLAEDVAEVFFAPTGGIVCPFEMTMAFAENAVENGVEFFLNTELTSIKKAGDHFVLETANDAQKTIEAKTVVNAAGVYADWVNNQLSERKLHITARKGEYMLLDKTAGSHVSHTIFQLPGKMGKGVLVTPTVHGNLLIGPTATDIENKEGVNTTQDGLDAVSAKSALSVKNVPLREVITSFAGLRAHEDGDDFVIGEAEDVPGFFNAAGIESPGLSSAPAIGVMVAGLVAEKLSLAKKEDFKEERKGIVRPSELSVEERNRLIKENPAYGTIICRCEMITEGEIIDAIKRPLGARSLDAVKRRTRAGMGRCQSGFCSPRTMEILEREAPMDIYAVSKSGGRSTFVVGKNKEVGRADQ